MSNFLERLVQEEKVLAQDIELLKSRLVHVQNLRLLYIKSPIGIIPKGMVGGPTPICIGMRGQIRQILSIKGRLRPVQVTEELLKTGFVYKGKTPIKIVVANELNKMAIAKKLDREDGVYFLNPSSQ